MKVEVTGRHLEITETAMDHARERADRLDRYVEGSRQLKVVVSHEGKTYRAEALLKAPMGNTFVGNGTGKDIIAAVDAAIEKVEHQLARFKDKIRAHKGKPSSKRE